VDTNWNCGSIGFLTLDPFNVDHELLTIALDDFANLLSFIMASNNLKQKWNINNISPFTEFATFAFEVRHTWTSSSLRMGMFRTLYFCLSSFDRGAVINFLRMWEGALKWRLRFLRREAVTLVFNFILCRSKSGEPEFRKMKTNKREQCVARSRHSDSRLKLELQRHKKY